MPIHLPMPKEQIMRATSRRPQPSHAKFGLAAVLALLFLGAMASIAVGRGPLGGFLNKAQVAHARKGDRSSRIGLADAAVVRFARSHGEPSLTSPESTALSPQSTAPESTTSGSTETAVATSRTRPSGGGGDTTPPETTIASGPSSATTTTTANFSFVSNESGSTFNCKVDAGRWSRCKPPRAYTGLALGSHQFAVRARDLAGNVDPTPATWSWSVNAEQPPVEEEAPPVEETPPPVEEIPPADTTPPETTISSGPGATTTAITASFSFSASEAGSTFQCKLDSGSWAGCSSPKSLSGLAVGTHAFSVRATDAAGNVDATPATRSWTVEAEPQPEPEPEPEPTPSPEAGCTTTIASVSAAQSSVASAAPGAVVCLADGSYGKVSLDATKAKPGVTLRAAHAGAATIGG